MDLELISSTGVATDIVSLDEMKRHLHITNSNRDLVITAAIQDTVDVLHGINGKLNRSIFPTRWVRYLQRFPKYPSLRCSADDWLAYRRIQLPYPPLRQVVSIWYEDMDGSSPTPELDTSKYIVRKNEIVGEVNLLSTLTWPAIATHPRAIGIMFDAGYTEYPPQLKRLIKLLAAHFIENPEATINDRVQAMVSRKIEFGVDYLMNSLRVPVAYDDWE